jgi:hypothetical protein
MLVPERAMPVTINVLLDGGFLAAPTDAGGKTIAPELSMAELCMMAIPPAREHWIFPSAHVTASCVDEVHTHAH